MNRADIFCHQGAAGRQAPVAVGGPRVRLIGPIGAADGFQPEPGTFNVEVSYSTADMGWVNALLMTAFVEWGTGTGHHVAEVDVPARGTQFTVTGADGLQVDVQAAGGCTDTTIIARASVAVNRAGPSICAQRTHRHVLPWGGGAASTRIPAFSREVRVMSDVAAPAMMAGAWLRFWQDPVIGALPYATVDVSDDRPHAVPQGAEFYDIVHLGGGAPNASIIWELRL